MSKNMLGVALCDACGPLKDLIDKLCGDDWKKWLEEFKLFLRGEPCWADEMMFKPLEWGTTLAGSVLDKYSCSIEAFIKDQGQSLSETPWRLPTITELRRGLKSGKIMFYEGCWYLSSTPETRQPGLGNQVMCINRGHISGSDFYSIRDQGFYIRLCREKKLD